MYSELRVEDRAELIKAAFLDELQTIFADRSQMTKVAIGEEFRYLRYLEPAQEAARTLSSAEQVAAARRLFPGRRISAGVRDIEMPAPLTRGGPAEMPPRRPAAAAAAEEVAGAPRPTAPVEAPAPAAGGAAPPAEPPITRPGAPAAGAVPRGEQVADQLGLMERWRLQGMRPSNWRHLLAPAAAGIGTTMLTGSPGLGIAAGLGTYGLGRLGRVGRGPTAVQQAAEEGEQAWRADMSAGKAVGTRAEYVERAHQKMQDVMRRNPLMAEEYYRAAAPSYLRGAAIAVPSALGLGYWGGKKMLEGITNTGEGDSGQGNFLQNLALSAGGVYGGKQIADWATQQGYLPSWAQWPVALAAGAIAPRVAGG